MQHHTRSQREEQDFHDIWSSGLRRDDQNGWKRLWEYKKSPLKMIFLQLCLSRVHICNFWASEHQMILSSCCSCRRKSCIGVAWKKKKRHVAPNNLLTLNMHQLKEGGGVWIANNCERAHSNSGLLYSLPPATNKRNSPPKKRNPDSLESVWRKAKWCDIKNAPGEFEHLRNDTESKKRRRIWSVLKGKCSESCLLMRSGWRHPQRDAPRNKGT